MAERANGALGDRLRAFVDGRTGDRDAHAAPYSPSVARFKHSQMVKVRRPDQSNPGLSTLAGVGACGVGASHQLNRRRLRRLIRKDLRGQTGCFVRLRVGADSESVPTRSQPSMDRPPGAAPSRRAAVPGGGWGLPLLGGRRGAGARGGGSSHQQIRPPPERWRLRSRRGWTRAGRGAGGSGAYRRSGHIRSEECPCLARA